VALRATVYRCELALSDVDRGVYGSYALTLARHPSETEERLMVRLLAFALFADDALEFGRGLSTEGEPDLWQRDATGQIERWIDVGLPDEREVRRACGRAREVVVLAYGGRRAAPWWSASAAALARLPNLRVLALDDEACAGLASLAARSMQLAATVHDGHVWLASASASVEIVPRQWLPAAAGP
jgi:uncharacterized protein YaeQ